MIIIFAKPMGSLQALVLIIAMIITTHSFYFREVVVTANTYTIRSFATYTFTLTRSVNNDFLQTNWSSIAVPAASNITIQFPSQYPPANIALSSCPNITINGVVKTNPTVIVLNNTVVISNTITSPQTISSVVLVLTNIKNPEPSLKTSLFVGTIGIDVAEPLSQAFVQLRMGSLSSCSATFSQGLVGTYDNLTIAITSLSAMASNNIIQVTFPISYRSSYTTTPIGITSSVVCLSSMGIAGVYCTQSSSNLNMVTAYNIFASANTTLSTSFQINYILVPPTIQPIDTITIATYTPAGVGYDSCTVSYSNLNAVIMDSLTLASNATISVGQSLPINISIPLITPLYNADYVLITMPSSYSPAYRFQGLACYYGNSVLPCILRSNGSQTLNFSISSTSGSIAAGGVLYVRMSNMIAPPSTGYSPVYTVSLYQADYLKSTGSLALSIFPNIITTITTTAVNPMIGAISSYNINYLSIDAVPGSGMIRILLPASIVADSSITQVAINGNTVTFSLVSFLNGLQLTNLPQLARNAAITISIASMRNPSTTDPISSSLTLSTYETTATTDLINTVQYVPTELVFTGPQTINYLVYSSSNTVAATNVSLLFIVTTQLGIASGGSISIILNQISASLTSTSCQLASPSQSIIYPCTISNTTSGNVLSINNLYSAQMGNSFNISIANAFTNPPSTSPSAYFTIITYSQLGLETERSSPFASSYLVISNPSNFITFTVTRTSEKNSDLSNYTISIRQPSVFSTTAVDINEINIFFPPQVSLASASCSNCIVNTALNNISVTLDNSAVSGLSSLSITIQKIINAPTFQPPSKNISAITILNIRYNYSVGSAPDNYLDTINSYPSDIILTNATAFSNFKIGEQNSLTLVLIPNNTFAYYYILTLSPQITGSVTCSISTGYTCTFNDALNYLVINKTSPSTIAPSTLTITVSNFKNPTITPSQTVVNNLKGYSMNHFIVNQYTGSLLTWSPSCNFPCQTCSSTNKSACLTCFTNTSISHYIYYYAVKQLCLSVCYSTQILSAGQCIDCTNNCMECSGTTSTCTACNTSTPYAYFYNFTCLGNSSCPQFHYPDKTYNCLKCPFPCETCLNSSRCITCAVGAFWYISNCVSTCPYNFTISNAINRTCDPCSSICATCLGTVETCTTCGAGTVKFNNSCYTNCTPPTYIYYADCVTDCVAPCLTCEILATSCKSCLTNTSQRLFLYQDRCLTSCPSGFVINLGANVCDSCSTLGINCSHCEYNANCSAFGGILSCPIQQYYSCIRCNPNLTYYFNTSLGVYQCITVVPDGYVSVNFVAQLCTPTCLTCTNFPTNCTYCSILNYFNGHCVSQCIDGYYSKNITIIFKSSNQSTLICSFCQGNCFTCLTQTQCLSCRQNTYYVGNYSCVNGSSCPSTTYGNDTYRNCTPCSSPCQTCYSYSGCYSCINSFYYYGGACINICPSGYFANIINNTCDPCQSTCATCQLSISTCTSCIPDYYFYSYNNTCNTFCPIGFTINYNLQICQNCTLPCLQCSDVLCYKCTSVNGTNYYLYQFMCLSVCPYGFFAKYDALNSTCVVCNQSCQSCINQTHCQTCAIGYYSLSPSICVTICPSYQPVPKIVSGVLVCSMCSDVNCSLCTPNDYCLQCKNYTFVLMSGKCSFYCPSGLIKVENISANSAQCMSYQQVVQPFIQGSTLTIPLHFPCCYLAAVFCFIAIIIKIVQYCCLENDRVLLFPLLAAAMAIPEMVATYLAGFTYFLLRFRIFLRGPLSWDIFIYLFAISIVAQIIVGFYTLIVETKIQWGDSVYIKWSKCSNCLQKLYQYGVNLLTIFNFKISHCLWCGIKSLPMLQSSNKLIFYNRPSGVSTIISLIITVDSILVLYFHADLAVIYYDIIIVIVVSLLFSLLALRRPTDFFIRHLQADPSLPLNRRVAESQNILIDGLHPINTFDEDYKSKLKKTPSYNPLDESISSRSSESSFNPLSSQRSSVHLQNMSIQYSNPQSSEKFSIRMNDDQSRSNSSEMQTLGTISVMANPGGASTLLNAINQKQESMQSDSHQNESISQVTENMLNTNIALLDMGQEESFSAVNDQQVLKEVLPKDLRNNYYDIQRCQSAHESMEQSEQFVYFSQHPSISRQESHSKQSPSASQEPSKEQSSFYFKEQGPPKEQSFSAHNLALSFDNNSIDSNISTVKKSESVVNMEPQSRSDQSIRSEESSYKQLKGQSSISYQKSKYSQVKKLPSHIKAKDESVNVAPNHTNRQQSIANQVRANKECKRSQKAVKDVSVDRLTKKSNQNISNHNYYNNSSIRSSEHFELYSIKIGKNDSVMADNHSDRQEKLSILSIQKSNYSSFVPQKPQQLKFEQEIQEKQLDVSANYSLQNDNGSLDSSHNQDSDINQEQCQQKEHRSSNINMYDSRDQQHQNYTNRINKSNYSSHHHQAADLSALNGTFNQQDSKIHNNSRVSHQVTQKNDLSQSNILKQSMKESKLVHQRLSSKKQKSNIFNIKDNSSFGAVSGYESSQVYNSNIFNQSNLSNVITLNNASNNPSLANSLVNSRHSLKNSRNSFGQQFPNDSQKLRTSSKFKEGRQHILEYEPGKEIISQQAQSVQFSEGTQSQMEARYEQSNGTVAADAEQNEFRIRTRKRKKTKQANNPQNVVKSKEKVVYVQQKQFKSLKKQADKINKQVRINKKIQRTIEQEHNRSINASNIVRTRFQKSGSRERPYDSPKKIEGIYMQRPFNSKEKK